MSNMFDLTGKVAIVTGGGSGIGRSMCHGLAEFGAEVIVGDLNEESAQETVSQLAQYGRRAIAVKVDVSNAAQVEQMVKTTIDTFGKLDIACNNAGGLFGRYRIHETPEDVWDRLIAINFKGCFLCTKAEVAAMLKQKKGSIINTASVGAILPGDPDTMGSIYDAAKAGVIAFSRKAAGEYGKEGIRINAIAPGMIMGTAFAAERRKDSPAAAAEKVRTSLERMALGRPGDPDELKGIVVYLASDAASYASGQVFVIDGGLS